MGSQLYKQVHKELMYLPGRKYIIWHDETRASRAVDIIGAFAPRLAWHTCIGNWSFPENFWHNLMINGR